MATLNLATNSKFLLALFEEGIFGACFSVLGFLPQICLMYLFLSILENSGLITRIAFLLDDLLTKVGLNGKMVYALLMGFGCSTTATISAQNMADKNSQIKVALITPFISCSAKLPIYITLGGALLGLENIWLILGLYLLGVVMAIVMAIVFERTILPSKDSGLLIEFPPIQKPQLKIIFQSIKTSCKQFIIKVFGVIFSASVLVWLLSNINIKFQYVGDIDGSLLYSFSCIISWLFKPIGLGNSAIICSLLIGIIAKELILSTFAISNKVGSLEALGASLICASSAVNFNIASGVSFLVFTLLYIPCISNFAVLLKTIGTKYTLIGVGFQLSLAYLIAYIIYTFLSRGVTCGLLVVLAVFIILLCIKIIYKKIKTKKIFCNCLTCNMCDKIKK
jgi:ferrous iron transport protein B